MNAKKTIATVLGIAVAATLAACSSSPTPEPTTTPTVTVEPTEEPTTPSPTEPATPEVIIPSEPGEVVPADQIDAAREAGVAVYVSPTGDGSGIVVDPEAALPEELITELESVDGIPQNMSDLSAQLDALGNILYAHDDAGTKVIVIFAITKVTGTSSEVTGYTAIGSAATDSFEVTGGSKSEALAAAQEFAAANPGTTVIDLTD